MERRSARIVLVGFALAIVGAYVVFAIANASYTFGCDYLTYDAAARRLLAGSPVYDLTATQTGSCGLYQYPPSFLVLVLPFTLLSPDAAAWAWIVVSVIALVAGTFAMPIRFERRVIVLVLAGTSWPFLYGLRIGQVEALLYLLFALGWRWLDRPTWLGATIAIGALTKLQPALLVLWALLTRRWLVSVVAVVLGVLAVAAGLLLDARLWLDAATVIRTISGSAADVGANIAPAAIALQLGVDASVSSIFGLLHTAAVIGLVLVAARRVSPDASFLATVLASQLLSPIQWTHYAVMLFLAIAWLLEQRQLWALLAALVLNMMFVGFTPPALYLVLADALLVATVWVGWTRTQPMASRMPVLVDG